MLLNGVQQRNLDTLSIHEGLGLLSDNRRMKGIEEPVVLISLGGLGGKTLNSIKREIVRRLLPGHAIRTLAIDSDKTTLRSLVERDDNPVGFLTEEETFFLGGTDLHGAAGKAAMPEHIKKWANPDIHFSTTGDGCGGVRQNGRFRLGIPGIYNNLRMTLTRTINSARDAASANTKVNVIFIAGISGGTGSGTFVDTAYIAQDILYNSLNLLDSQVKIAAYLFMPDVQSAVPGITVPSLNRNGYAALKELDYYYNLDKVNGTYKWPFSEGAIKDSERNIYDFCTLISGKANGGAFVKDPERAAIDVVTESVMAMLADISLTSNNGMPEQLLTSFLDNVPNDVQIWYGNGGMSKNIFPRSANYAYNVVGYGSTKVPIDSIMAYMAHEMFGAVLDEYESFVGNLNESLISKIVNASGINMEDVIENVKSASGCQVHLPNTLEPGGGDIVKKNEKFKKALQFMLRDASEKRDSKDLQDAVQKQAEDVIRSIDREIERCFNEYGPYFVVHMITGEKADGHSYDGILKKIRDQKNRYGSQLTEWSEYYKTDKDVINDLYLEAEKVQTGLLGMVSKDERDRWLRKAKGIVETAYINTRILDYMEVELSKIYDNFLYKNNKVFDTYTKVLDHVSRSLNKDAQMSVHGHLDVNDGGSVYSIDIVNLDEATENGRKLRSCLGSCLTEAFIGQFKSQFQSMIRDPGKRPAFTSTGDEFNAQKELRQLFDRILGNFYAEAVERFVIAYYNDEPLSSGELDQLMSNDAQKARIMDKAVENILDQLQKVSNPLCSVIGGASLDQFASAKKYLSCPDQSIILYQTIASKAPRRFPGVQVCRCRNATSIDLVTSYYGIALCKIAGMAEADLAYSKAVDTNAVGLHLDENPLADWRELPAPLVREVWPHVAADFVSPAEQKNYEKIERDVAFARTAMISQTAVDGYFQLRVLSQSLSEEQKEEVKALIQKKQQEFSGAETAQSIVWDAISELGYKVEDVPVKVMDSGIDCSDPDNLLMIVRKNFDLYRQLKRTLLSFKELYSFAEDLLTTEERRLRMNRDLLTFEKCVKTRLIVHEKGRAWVYMDDGLQQELYFYDGEGKFAELFSMYFAFRRYRLLNEGVRGEMDDLAQERMKQDYKDQQYEEVMKDIEKEKTRLFSQEAGEYNLSRELNRKDVNNRAKNYADEFAENIAGCSDAFDMLRYFYREAFNI